MDSHSLGRSMRLSVAEGALATVMGSLFSGVFLTGFALALGATRLQIGILFALPALCGIAQLAGSYWIERFGRCKRLCLAASLVSRLLYLPVLLVPLLATHLSQSERVWSIIGLMAASHLLGSLAGVAWLTWIKDLIPGQEIVRFFGRRNLVNTALSFGVCLAAGAAVDALNQSWGENAGFVGVFAVAMACGLIGLPILARIPAAEAAPRIERPAGPRVGLMEPLKAANFRRLVGFYAMWNLAVNVAAPFVPVYLLQKLGLPLWYVVVLSTISSLMGLVANNAWTALAHRFGTKPVVLLATLADAFGPLLLVFTDASAVWLLLLIHAGGMFNTPLAVGPDNFVLKLAPRQNASSYMAVFRAVVGPATAIAAIFGGWAAGSLQGDSVGSALPGLKMVFLASFGLRLASLGLLAGVAEPGAYSLLEIGRLLLRWRRRAWGASLRAPRPAMVPEMTGLPAPRTFSAEELQPTT
jgi:MFS family permease